MTIVSLTLVWGSSFVVSKDVLATLPVALLAALRSGTALVRSRSGAPTCLGVVSVVAGVVGVYGVVGAWGGVGVTPGEGVNVSGADVLACSTMFRRSSPNRQS